MEHVVFFTSPGQGPQFRRTPSLDEAVRFVESLRNGEGIDDSLVYALTEVPLRFQTYYRVEVPADATSSAPPAAPWAPEPAAPAPIAAPPALPLAEPTSFAPVEPVFSEPVPAFEPVAVGAETSGAPLAAAAPDELLPPAPVEAFEPLAQEMSVPDLLNGPDDEPADAASNGKPHRGLGFFAR